MLACHSSNHFVILRHSSALLLDAQQRAVHFSYLRLNIAHAYCKQHIAADTALMLLDVKALCGLFSLCTTQVSTPELCNKHTCALHSYGGLELVFNALNNMLTSPVHCEEH